MIENAIQYFKERIDVEKQICNLPTCDEWVKKKKLRKIEYMKLAIQALEMQKEILKCNKCAELDGCFEGKRRVGKCDCFSPCGKGEHE